jgi:glycine dehydrogenase subunit 1
MMAVRATGRRKIVVDTGVSPIYRKMLYCYTSNLSIDFHEIEIVHGQSNRKKIFEAVDNNTAAIILQNPNFFGAVDDFTDIIAKVHEKGAIAVVSAYPVSLGMLKAPGDMGADIVTGEGQSLGIPLSFGGPYLGFMATKQEYVRKMPGRIVGMTVDTKGRQGFVLTLQAREQHIRREKATSNICSNEALCAARAVMYLSLLGKGGFRDLAITCAKKAEYAKTRLSHIRGVEIKKTAPTFNEFTIALPRDARPHASAPKLIRVSPRPQRGTLPIRVSPSPKAAYKGRYSADSGRPCPFFQRSCLRCTLSPTARTASTPSSVQSSVPGEPRFASSALSHTQ